MCGVLATSCMVTTLCGRCVPIAAHEGRESGGGGSGRMEEICEVLSCFL